MKDFIARYTEIAMKSDQDFALGWLGLMLTLIIGDIINIDDRGIFSWWGLLYVLTGAAIYLAGQKWANVVLAEKLAASWSKGYGDGVNGALKSFDTWNGRP